MRARTRIEVTRGGVLAVVACEPPLTVRRVRGADAAVCALCLVGTAAGPLPGDDLELDLRVGPGAAATLRAAGASIAQGTDITHGTAPDVPRAVKSAVIGYRVDVGPGGRLDADPGALVVAASADVVVDLRLDLAPDAELTWRESVVLGRTGQLPGRVVLRWDVRRGGRPLLRQDVDLADPFLRRWPGMVGGAKVLTTVLRVGPDLAARTEVRSATDVTQRLADGATLTTELQAAPVPR